MFMYGIGLCGSVRATMRHGSVVSGIYMVYMFCKGYDMAWPCMILVAHMVL